MLLHVEEYLDNTPWIQVPFHIIGKPKNGCTYVYIHREWVLPITKFLHVTW